MGAVSIHAPITEVYPAIQQNLVSKHGGNLYWVRQGKLARWENLDVFPPNKITMSIWVFGDPGNENTAYIRVGWWRLYVIDFGLNRFRPAPVPVNPFQDRGILGFA